MGIQKKIISPIILLPEENHCYNLVNFFCPFLMHIKHFDKVRIVLTHLCILVFRVILYHECFLYTVNYFEMFIFK